MAKQSFESGKYFLKRNSFKKSNKLDGSSAAAEKAKKDLDPYFFLSLIDQYLKPRSTKSNIHVSTSKALNQWKKMKG